MASANCMELRYLKSFVVAAKLLNFSEAAREMCVTQSTFSQTIKRCSSIALPTRCRSPRLAKNYCHLPLLPSTLPTTAYAA